MKKDTWVILGGIAIALYVAYKMFDKFKEKVNDFADALAKPIADAYIGITLPGDVSVNAQIRIPNGELISADSVNIAKTVGKEEFTFSYMGTRYQLLPRTAAGPYQARKLS